MPSRKQKKTKTERPQRKQSDQKALEMLFYRDDEISEREQARLQQIKDDLGIYSGNGLLRLVMRVTNAALGYKDDVFYPMVRGQVPEDARPIQEIVPEEHLNKLETAIGWMVTAARLPGYIIPEQRRKEPVAQKQKPKKLL